MAEPQWRQKAIDFFPDLYAQEKEIDKEDPPFSFSNTYQLFFELLPFCRDATTADDEETVAKVYAYAEWCAFQEDKDVWNAAGVCFYEHLVDEPETLTQIPRRLSPDVFVMVSGLLEWRMSADEGAFEQLVADFACYHHIPPDELERRIHPPAPPTNDSIPAINGAYEI